MDDCNGCDETLNMDGINEIDADCCNGCDTVTSNGMERSDIDCCNGCDVATDDMGPFDADWRES